MCTLYINYLILYLYDAVVNRPTALVSLLQGSYINIWLFVKYTKTSYADGNVRCFKKISVSDNKLYFHHQAFDTPESPLSYP